LSQVSALVGHVASGIQMLLRHVYVVVSLTAGVYIRRHETSVPEQYRGIGIRIEDDVMITGREPRVLTSAVPKEISDVSKLCARNVPFAINLAS